MTEKVAIVGTVNMELILTGVDRLPEWGKQIHGSGCQLTAAGSGPRVAFPLNNLGVKSHLIGKIGDDIYGQKILDTVRSHNLDTAGIEVSGDLPTGLCVSLVQNNAERALIGFLGAINETNQALLRKKQHLIEKTDILIITGYWNMPGLRKGLREIVREMKKKGKKILLDTGWNLEDWPEEDKKEILSLLPFVDVFLPNIEEAAVLSGKHSLKEMAKFFCEKGVVEAIIKSGKKGSAGFSGKEGFCQKEPLTVKALDTTAAGEAFNAGIIYGLIKRWNLEKKLEFANTLAGLAISDSKGNYPSLRKINVKMKEAYAEE